MNAKTLLKNAKAKMKPEEISFSDWHTDLYLKATPISKELIDHYDWKENIVMFVSPIDHSWWYEIPFANTDVWEKWGCYCGNIED